MPPTSATTTPRRIGRYVLQHELGRGGMGVVYAARDETLGRRVALKLLRADGPGADPAAEARFEAEMRIAVALEHPNVVPVHETGTEDGVRYIAMRLVDGEDLGVVLRREGALAPGRVARIGRQVGAALDAAHARGLIHRDVKPGNILLTGSGDEEHAYLTDFGLTRELDAGVTQTGQWIGTVDYAAPEQIEAGTLTPRTDVYAFGCVLHHALTGELPFRGTFAAKATAHVSQPLPPTGFPRVDAVLATATAKDPDRRFASAGALARAFARAVAEADRDDGQHTMAMPVLVPEDAEPEDAAPTVVQRRRAVAAPLPPVTAPATAATAATTAAPGRRKAPRVAALLACLLLIGAVVGVLLGGGDDNASRATASGTGSGASAGKKTASSAKASTTAKAVAASVATIPTTSYTAAKGGYTARVPSGDGWSVQGEQDLGGVLRTTVTGPDGQQLWIDATPSMAPSFGTNGRQVTDQRTLAGPLGTIRGYRFTGEPAALCAGGCVDYQLDLGGRGYAVLAGPTPAARLAARRTILSIQPAPAPAAPAQTTPAPAASTPAPAAQTPAAQTPAAPAGPPGRIAKELRKRLKEQAKRGREKG